MFYSAFLIRCPHFHQYLSYQSQSPIICGFAPEAYAQPWLGLHSLNLPHAPSFDSRRKAEDVLKEAIIHSTWGGAVTTVRADPPASTSTAPAQVSRRRWDTSIAWSSPQFSICSTLSLQTQMRKIPFSTAIAIRHLVHGWEFSIRARIKGKSIEFIEFIRIEFQVWQWQRVPKLDPQLGLKPVQVRDQCHSVAVSAGGVKVLSGDEASGGEHDVSYSTDKADVYSRQYTSAQHLRCRQQRNSQMQSAWSCTQKWHRLCSLEGETNQWRREGHRRAGQHGEWLYGWEEKAQESWPHWPPPFPTWRNAGCFSPWLLQPILWGYVIFTMQTLMCLCLRLQSHWPLWSM